MGETGEATQSPTEAGTVADSPDALAIAAGSQAGSQPANVTEVDRGSKIHVFHLFGATAPIAVITLSFVLGGDPIALRVLWIGTGILAGCNAWLVWLTSRPERYRPQLAMGLWLVSVVGGQGVLYYFGVFSGAVMVSTLPIVFCAFGRTRWIAIATLLIATGAHAVMALPIALGWAVDRGLFSSAGIEMYRMLIAEALLLALYISGYALGRWARRSNAAAMSELQSAMRIIGDKEQALAEVEANAARQNRVDEGRWTGHTMGSFRLGLVLGRGAMGEVYEASSLDGKPAAVKLLNARSTTSTSLVERFHREMQLAVRLESPHIVKVFELSPIGAPVPYIAMERLYGTDLATQLRNANRMPVDELAQLIDQVARGLEVARLAGVVHRDLKPHNLFHHERAIWKILDFGVSKLVGGEGTLTGEGIVGTPQYMAPEQASGGDVTHLADVYALGAIAYRCLTGRSPFKGNDLSELVYQVVHTLPARPSSFGRVSIVMEDVLATAMAKRAEHRFSSAIAFAEAFTAARRGSLRAVRAPANAWSER